ncbi:MAG: HigA family addiction module antidote protein [Spirochaetes bacterium]|nr:HigA family addiction module antidote protein [Spirochaetota bacterium]MBN2772545.1 HigA family addiction module antidote protein [Spirochaetota bacterium]
MITERKPTHPGEVLKEDVIKPLNLTITEAADDLGISRKHLSQLVNGHKSLTPDMAIRIGKATGTSPESWLNMQSKLDLWYANQKICKVIPFPEISEVDYAILK